MAYEVRVVDVEPTVVASTRKRIRWNEIKANIRPLFDIVYAFLRTAQVKPNGHNVCVYRTLSDREVEMEAAVQVDGTFVSTEAVQCVETPHGRAVMTTHIGPYDKLGGAYDAIKAWSDAQGVRRSAIFWELYGDWEEDPAKLRTDVFWLLE